MDIKNYKPGQTVYIKLIGNACINKNEDQLIEEWEVVSVGRKYIKAKKKGMPDFCIETFENRDCGYDGQFVQKTNYCTKYVMYANRKEIEEEIEEKQLATFLSDYFKRYNSKDLSLDSLRKIYDLIKTQT